MTAIGRFLPFGPGLPNDWNRPKAVIRVGHRERRFQDRKVDIGAIAPKCPLLAKNRRIFFPAHSGAWHRNRDIVIKKDSEP